MSVLTFSIIFFIIVHIYIMTVLLLNLFVFFFSHIFLTPTVYHYMGYFIIINLSCRL